VKWGGGVAKGRGTFNAEYLGLIDVLDAAAVAFLVEAYGGRLRQLGHNIVNV
jgi:hypothetical protein